jgi:hypothetical protein
VIVDLGSHPQRGRAGLEELAVQALARLGALVEPVGEGLYEALLPEALAAELGRGELIRLAADRDADPDAERLVYGAPLVDRLLELGAARLVAEVELLESGHASPQVAARLAQELIVPQNASVRDVRSRAVQGQALLLTFRYRAQCEDTLDGLVAVAVDAVTAAPLREIEPLRAALRLAEPRWRGTQLADAARIDEAARSLVEPEVLQRIQEFRADVERRRGQDAERLQRYYGGLIADLYASRQGGAYALSAEQLAARRESFEREYLLKCQELRLRSRIEVDIRLVAVLRVDLPTVAIEVDVLRRRKMVTLRTRYVPLLRELEPPLCGSCAGTCTELWICDEGHVLCGRASCFGACAGCGRRTCPLCQRANVCRGCGLPRGEQPKAQAAAAPAVEPAVEPAAEPPQARHPQTPQPAEPAAAAPASRPKTPSRARRTLAPHAGPVPAVAREAPSDRSGAGRRVQADAAPAQALAELLRTRGPLRPAAAREALGLEQAELRQAMGELVAAGLAEVTGHGRGITYGLKAR